MHGPTNVKSCVLVIGRFQWLIWLKGKSSKTFDIIFTESVFLNCDLEGFEGAAAPKPPPAGYTSFATYF